MAGPLLTSVTGDFQPCCTCGFAPPEPPPQPSGVSETPRKFWGARGPPTAGGVSWILVPPELPTPPEAELPATELPPPRQTPNGVSEIPRKLLWARGPPTAGGVSGIHVPRAPEGPPTKLPAEPEQPWPDPGEGKVPRRNSKEWPCFRPQ